MEQSSFQRDLEKNESLIEGINELYDFKDVENIVGNIEKIVKLKENIQSIKNERERYEIIHRHVREVIIDNIIFDYQFNNGKKNVKGKSIKIELFNGEVLSYQMIPNSGTHIPIFLKINETNKKREKIEYEYLGRFYDEGKKRRHKKEKEKRAEKWHEQYPENKYARGYEELAKFLGFSGKYALHYAFRWVKNGILKEAIISKYNGKNIFDKSKCLNLLNNVALKRGPQGRAAKKILTSM